MQTEDLAAVDSLPNSLLPIPNDDTIQLHGGEALKEGVIRMGNLVYKRGQDQIIQNEAILHARIWTACPDLQTCMAKPVALVRDHQGVLYFVTEYVGTTSMFRYIQEHPDHLPAIAQKVLDVLETFQTCKIYHRDLHTNNIMIHDNTFKIIDFGNAQIENMYYAGGENYPVNHHPSRDVGIFLRSLAPFIRDWVFLEKYDKIMRAYERETRDHVKVRPLLIQLQDHLEISHEATILHMYRQSPSSVSSLDYKLAVYNFSSLHPKRVKRLLS